MSKITLTVKNGTSKESVQFEIDRITTMQMIKLKNEVGAIMKELKANGELTNVLGDLLGGESAPSDGQDAQTIALEQMKDERFVNGIAGAFDKLLETVPERAFNILAITSGIDREILESTYFEELFDVYDAVMEENDIMKIVDRVKKSFFGTKEKWGAMIGKAFNK